MLDFSYSNILHSNLINFLIMLSLFVFLFKFLDVPKKIKIAADNIKDNIEKSRKDKENSELILKETESKYKKLDTEVKKIVDNANKTSDDFMSKAIKEAENLVEIIKQDCEKIYEREVFKIKKDVALDMSNKSLQKSTEKLKEIFKDKKLQEQYLNASIEKLEEIEF